MTITTTYQVVKGFRRFTPLVSWDSTYGSYVGNYPASNLSDLPLARICRTSDLTLRSTRYLGVADRARPCRLLGICRHNLSIYSKLRVRLYSTAPATFSVNAATDVVTSAAHGLLTGMGAVLWSTDTLPGGIVDGSVYYVRALDANTYTLHPTKADALAGTNTIDITSAGVGTLKCNGGLIYDSGWFDTWTRVYDDTPEWEDDNWWTGKYLDEEVAGVNVTRPYLFDAVYLTRAVSIEVDDASNLNGSVDIGLMELSRGWQFSVNPSVDAKFGFRFRTRSAEAWGGAMEFERLEKPRRFQGTVAMMPHNEVMEQGYEDLRQNDLDTPFLWVPFPQNGKHWLRDCFLARNLDPGFFGFTAAPGYDSLPISIEEVL